MEIKANALFVQKKLLEDKDEILKYTGKDNLIDVIDNEYFKYLAEKYPDQVKVIHE